MTKSLPRGFAGQLRAASECPRISGPRVAACSNADPASSTRSFPIAGPNDLPFFRSPAFGPSAHRQPPGCRGSRDQSTSTLRQRGLLASSSIRNGPLAAADRKAPWVSNRCITRDTSAHRRLSSLRVGALPLATVPGSSPSPVPGDELAPKALMFGKRHRLRRRLERVAEPQSRTDFSFPLHDFGGYRLFEHRRHFSTVSATSNCTTASP